MRREVVLVLLVGVLRSQAARPRRVPSELAFTVPHPARRWSGGGFTGRVSEGRDRGQVGRPAGAAVLAPATTHPRRRNRVATALPAATKTASVRLGPLDGRSSGGGGGGARSRSGSKSRTGSTSTSTSRSTKGGRGKGSLSSSKRSTRTASPSSAMVTASPPKTSARSPRSPPLKKATPLAAATDAVAAAAAEAGVAAVDPLPPGSAFVYSLPVTTNGRRSVTTSSAEATAAPEVHGDADGAAGHRAPPGGANVAAAPACPATRKKISRKAPAAGKRSGVGRVVAAAVGAGQKLATTPKRKSREVSAKQAKALRTGGRAFLIVCDAESITFHELAESIDILDELGTRDVGVIYADWSKAQDWRSEIFNRSKARDFKLLQRDPVPTGSNPRGDDTMTAEVVALAKSEEFKKHEFCLLSADGSLTELAARLRAEGVRVRGVGRRQAPTEFIENCDAFMYIDPANRFELLSDEGLVLSVALCIALAAAGQERCDWVRMKTIVNSLHAWDLGLQSPNFYGYPEYDEMVIAMDSYVTGVEDTSGEVVVKVPPKPKAMNGEVPRGLEDVATYLYQKWVSFTKDPRMNDILLACIPACLQALSAARAEMDVAVKRFQRDDEAKLGSPDFLLD